MSESREIFLIPYAHLDTQWRWEYPTTIGKYLKNTIEDNLLLFRKYKGHCFNFTGARRYAMMKEYFPELFEEVLKLIDQERWYPAGTCLDETDALIPSSESLIRNVLYGDRWQKRELGWSSRDYMIPDCFGFPANMPTLMAHCGLEGFSSQKLTWGSSVGIPFGLGMWRGPDGSEILSALDPCAYVSKLLLPVKWNPQRLGKLKRIGKKTGVWKSLQYYGVGDIGGAPKRGSVRRALFSINSGRSVKVRQGSPTMFFRDVKADEREKLNRYDGDFLLTNHSAGSITSAAIMKRWNRRNEQLAFAAEQAAFTAMLYCGTPYPSEKINTAWSLVIGSQMHDILPGTSTPTAYEYSQNDEIIALKTWNAVLEDSAENLAPRIPGEGEILLFNPLGEARQSPVDLQLLSNGYPVNGEVVLESSRGERFPGIIAEGEAGPVLTFIPHLPPLSWTRFSLKQPGNNAPIPVRDPVSLSDDSGGYCLENETYRVTVSRRGSVVSIFFKETGREILEKPLAWEFQKENPRIFPAWNMHWEDREKAPYLRIEEGDEVSVVEDSRLRVTIRVIKTLNGSRFVREISLASCSQIVELTERIDWREKGCSLKAALHTSLENPVFTGNWETSRIKREINHSRIFETPSRLWADLSDKETGISILEDSKYGWDHPDGKTMRLTLLFTPNVRPIDGFRDQKYQDWGEHTIRYGIYAHRGDWRGTDVHGRAFNLPVQSFLVEGHSSEKTGELPSLITLSFDQIGLMALKKREDDGSLLLRFCERHGCNASARVRFPFSLLQVDELNGLEEHLRSLEINADSFVVELPPNGIGTFAVRFGEKTAGTSVRQKNIDLEYNCRLIGENLFPPEITPGMIGAGSFSFKLSVAEGNNALKCEGQKISVPGGFNTLSLLAGAQRECPGRFRWLDQKGDLLDEAVVDIPSLTGFAGQWDSRIWKREPKHAEKMHRDYLWNNRCTGVNRGYVYRQRLEWFSSHIHEGGKDLYYRYGYMYNLTFAVPEGASVLELPDDGLICLFSATVRDRKTRIRNIRLLTDKYDF